MAFILNTYHTMVANIIIFLFFWNALYFDDKWMDKWKNDIKAYYMIYFYEIICPKISHLIMHTYNTKGSLHNRSNEIKKIQSRI